MTESYIHTRRLAQFLEMDAMGKVELKKTVEKSVPRELSYHDFDGKIVNARELLVSEGIQGTTLIPTEIYATVIEGSEPARCFREALPVYRMNGMTMKMPYGETGTYAPIVAEGAEIPAQDQTYTAATFTATKYAVRPVITNEMVEDAQFDIIASEVRKSGYRMENALNYLALDQILDNHGNESDCGSGGATPLIFAAKAVALIQADGFSPDTLIVSPEFLGLTMAEAIPFTNQYAVEVIKSGRIGNIMGCSTYLLGIAETTSGSHVWGFSTNDYVGALMYDSRAVGAIGMRRDITVDRYADSIRQMQGVSVSARWDVEPFIANASSTIIY
jgi:hypothetical protein